MAASSLESRHPRSVLEDKSAVLTPREFALVYALLLRPGTILARAELKYRIYGWNEEVESNAIDFLIHSACAKLAPAAIKTFAAPGVLRIARHEASGRIPFITTTFIRRFNRRYFNCRIDYNVPFFAFGEVRKNFKMMDCAKWRL